MWMIGGCPRTQSFLFQRIDRCQHRSRSRSRRPVPTIIAARENHGLVQPYLIDVNHGDDHKTGTRVASIDEPLGTVTSKRGKAVIQPFLKQYNGTGTAEAIDEPLTTVTTKHRQGLAVVTFGQRMDDLRGRFAHRPAMISLINTMEELGIFDIGYRMLENDELKQAQGFPADYQIMGTKAEVTKQIGNSVHTAVARAICQAIGGAGRRSPKPVDRRN